MSFFNNMNSGNKSNYMIYKKVGIVVFGFLFLMIYVYLSYFRYLLLKKYKDEHSKNNQYLKTIEKFDSNTVADLQLKSSNKTDIQKYVMSAITTAIKQNNIENPKTRGPIGPKGDTGLNGENGGMYQRVGAIKNLKNPTLNIERTVGTGNQSVAYLNDNNYESWQQWMLTNDNKLQSVYNPSQCLSYDLTNQNNGINIFMKDCNITNTDKTNNTFQYVQSTSQLKIPDKNNTPTSGKCLSITPAKTITSTIINNYDNKNKTPEQLINKQFVNVEDCDISKKEQRWNFH